MSWHVASDVAWLRTDDEPSLTYIASVATGTVFCLNQTAGLVWESADGADDIAAVTHHVADQMGIEVAQIATDVETCVDDLVNAGLLKKSGDLR